MTGSFGSRFEGLCRLGIFVHAVDAGPVFHVVGIALIFVAANGQEGDDDDGDGSVSAVAVAVFDDVGQPAMETVMDAMMMKAVTMAARMTERELIFFRMLISEKRAVKPKTVVTPVEMRHSIRKAL